MRAISGTPSWLLVLLDKLAEMRPEVEQRIVNYYPRLELLIHGGMDFKPYAKRQRLADFRMIFGNDLDWLEDQLDRYFARLNANR